MENKEKPPGLETIEKIWTSLFGTRTMRIITIVVIVIIVALSSIICLLLHNIIPTGNAPAESTDTGTPVISTATDTPHPIITTTPSKTQTPSKTATVTKTSTITKTPTITLTPTISLTPTRTVRPSDTRMPTATSPPYSSGNTSPLGINCDCDRTYYCSDTGASVCFYQCGGSASYNWSQLDADGDGVPCESN